MFIGIISLKVKKWAPIEVVERDDGILFGDDEWKEDDAFPQDASIVNADTQEGDGDDVDPKAPSDATGERTPTVLERVKQRAKGMRGMFANFGFGSATSAEHEPSQHEDRTTAEEKRASEDAKKKEARAARAEQREQNKKQAAKQSGRITGYDDDENMLTATVRTPGFVTYLLPDTNTRSSASIHRQNNPQRGRGRQLSLSRYRSSIRRTGRKCSCASTSTDNTGEMAESLFTYSTAHLRRSRLTCLKRSHLEQTFVKMREYFAKRFDGRKCWEIEGIAGGLDYDQYLSIMGCDGTWGGEPVRLQNATS